MAMSRTEAEEALSEIARTAGRSQALRAYRGGAPILMLWGVVWAVGYLAMGVLPAERWAMIWIPLDLVGFAATVLMGRRMRGAYGQAKSLWRALGAILAILAFYAATIAILQPRAVNAYLAFPGLVAGVIYALTGIWGMTRYIWIGVALFIATLTGFFWLASVLPFWMAATGGGALIAGGIWLQRA